MIASNDNGSLNLSLFHQIVHREPKLSPLTVTEPADSRGQTLELNALLGQVDPALQYAIVRKQLKNQIVCHVDVGRLTRKSNPTKWAAALAEQWTNVSR